MNVRMSALLAIILLSWWGLSHRATAAKTEGELLHSPSLLETREFILSEDNQESSDAQCDSDGNCYRTGGTSPDIPNIISPRRTWLLDQQPTLRWYAVEGVESYSVEVIGVGVSWKRDEVEATSIVYDGQPLQPGETYLLMVDANNGEPASEEIFTMLSADKAAIAREEMPQKQPQDEAGLWDLVQFYLKYDLTSEAIETLEALADRDTQKAEVYCQLSKLYKNIGLRDFADDSQKTALELGGCD